MEPEASKQRKVAEEGVGRVGRDQSRDQNRGFPLVGIVD